MSKESNAKHNEIQHAIHELSVLKEQNAKLSQTGHELIATQEKLHALLHNAPDGIITFSADGCVETFNIAAQHIFGYSESEIVTRKIPDLIPCPDWVEGNVGTYIRYFISSRSSNDIHLVGKHRIGFDILLHVSTGQASEENTTRFDEDILFDTDLKQAPFAIKQDSATDHNVKNNSIVCFFRDITVDKKIKKELEDHKHALDLAAGIIIRDKNFRVTDVNEKFCQMLGRNRTEFIGEQFIQSKFGGIPNSDLKLRQRREFLSQGNPWAGESCFLNHLNEQTWFTESTTPFLGDNNIPYQYLSILIDITDRKVFEHQLQQHGDNLQDLVDDQINDIRHARDAAEEANKSKSEFLANISHELRTPMHGIISFTNLSLKQFKTLPLDEKRTEKVQKFLSNIETSSKRLLSLLNNLLDLSKLESGKEEFNFEQTDIHQLSQQIYNEYSARVDEKNINFIISEPTQPFLVFCDKNKILQIISNLVANAIKFSPENKKITITFERNEILLGKRASDIEMTKGITLSITDYGVGIPDNELNAVFDKFIQSSKTKSGAGGTGLGLSISHEIAIAHKGKLWAEHNPDGGAIFRLFLPS